MNKAVKHIISKIALLALLAALTTPGLITHYDVCSDLPPIVIDEI